MQPIDSILFDFQIYPRLPPARGLLSPQYAGLALQTNFSDRQHNL